MTLKYAAISYELREISLQDKPTALLNISAKATVPTMVLPDDTVLDESADIIQWALQQHDPDQWQRSASNDPLRNLMTENDLEFKQYLDLYKYADRHPQYPASHYRNQAETFLQKLESRLQNSPCLLDDKISIADVFIFPFIRQFAFVDKIWFDQTSHSSLQNWLRAMLESKLFKQVMIKQSVWRERDEAVIIRH